MSVRTRITELSIPQVKIALVTPEKPASTADEPEERMTPFIPYDKLRTLYQTSGLIFGIVEKYVKKVTSDFYFEGEAEAVKDFTRWANDVKLKRVLSDSVRDILLAGGAWGENVLTKDGRDISKLKTLNPETMDFIRKRATNMVSVLPDDSPEGYERTVRGFKKIQWRKESITIGGKEEIKAGPGEDLRDRIFYLKLWSFAETFIGYTPLVSIYKDELIRLNISDAVGESAFRGTGLIATVSSPEGVEIPDETMTRLETDLKQVRSKTIFVFPENIKLDRFPAAEFRDMHSNLDYFAGIVCTGMGTKRELLVTPVGRRGQEDIEAAREEFEGDIQFYQEILADQVNEQIIRYRAQLKGLKDYPKLVLRSSERAIKLSTARRRATLARAGLLTYDPELEIRLRDEEALPHSLLDLEKEKWDPARRVINKPVIIKES